MLTLIRQAITLPAAVGTLGLIGGNVVHLKNTRSGHTRSMVRPRTQRRSHADISFAQACLGIIFAVAAFLGCSWGSARRRMRWSRPRVRSVSASVSATSSEVVFSKIEATKTNFESTVGKGVPYSTQSYIYCYSTHISYRYLDVLRMLSEWVGMLHRTTFYI